MVKYTCQNCDKQFDQKSHYEKHLQRKRPCKKHENNASVNKAIVQESNIGLINIRSYSVLKEYIDKDLNKDNSLFETSNDEPTPIGCIEEMMENVPDFFWNNKHISILDPCCGNGNFHFVISNLLKKHEHSVDDINNILHFNDINQNRLKNVKDIFGDKVNITSVDFLKEEYSVKYDMIVMNPPYAKIMENGSRASKNHGLFIPFMQKALNILNAGGFLISIVPDSWMSLADRNTFCRELTQYQFHVLNIHTAKKWFPKIGSSFTWFVVQKKEGTDPFKVVYMKKNEQFTSIVKSQIRSYIPLYYSNIIQSIFDKTIDNDSIEKYKVETSSNLHKYTQRNLIQDTESTEFKYRLIHTPKQTVWANRPHKFQDGWKVFISTTDKYQVFPDNCGMTQSIAFIQVENEESAKNITKILLHPLYVFLNNACRYGNFNNIRILQKFPICKTDDPFKEFNITSQEISLISS